MRGNVVFAKNQLKSFNQSKCEESEVNDDQSKNEKKDDDEES